MATDMVNPASILLNRLKVMFPLIEYDQLGFQKQNVQRAVDYFQRTEPGIAIQLEPEKDSVLFFRDPDKGNQISALLRLKSAAIINSQNKEIKKILRSNEHNEFRACSHILEQVTGLLSAIFPE